MLGSVTLFVHSNFFSFLCSSTGKYQILQTVQILLKSTKAQKDPFIFEKKLRILLNSQGNSMRFHLVSIFRCMNCYKKQSYQSSYTLEFG